MCNDLNQSMNSPKQVHTLQGTIPQQFHSIQSSFTSIFYIYCINEPNGPVHTHIPIRHSTAECFAKPILGAFASTKFNEGAIPQHRAVNGG